MMPLSFVFLGVIIHEFLSLLTEGKAYIKQNFIPVFGVHLNPFLFNLIRIALILVCAFALIFQPNIIVNVIAVFLLTLYILSYPIRLSNHLMLVWFVFLFAAFNFFEPNASELKSCLKIILLVTYLSAAFHKFNSSYADGNLCCVNKMISSYFHKKKIDNITLFKYSTRKTRYIVLFLEFLIPLFLLYDPTVKLGIILGLLMHLVFGLLIHVHFSIIMVGLISSYFVYFPWEQPDAVVLGFCTILGILVGVKIGFWENAFYKSGLIVLMVIFSIFLLYLMWFVSANPVKIDNSVSLHNPVNYILIAFFIINSISPYLGFKTAFSFAMFSNLRIDKWNHLVIRRPLWRFNCLNLVIVIRYATIGNVAPELKDHLENLKKSQLYYYSEHYFYYVAKKFFEENNGCFEIIFKNQCFTIYSLSELNGLPWTVFKRFAFLPSMLSKYNNFLPVCE